MGDATIFHDSAFGPFIVDDQTGTAYVDPADADLVLTEPETYSVDAGEEPPSFIREFIERETSVEAIGDHPRRFEEYRLDVGESARVAGETDPDLATDIEGTHTTAIVSAGRAPKFFVTDDAALDLGKRMRQEALVRFLAGGVLLAMSYMFLVM